MEGVAFAKTWLLLIKIKRACTMYMFIKDIELTQNLMCSGSVIS